MTNEEKANEIAKNIIPDFLFDENCFDIEGAKFAQEGCYQAALEMAEWKDQQFISMLPEIFDFFNDCIGLYDGAPSHEDTDKPWFINEFTNRILKNKS